MIKMKDFISGVVNSLCEKTKNLFSEEVKIIGEEHQPLEPTMLEINTTPSLPSEPEEKLVRMLTVSEAAKINRVTRQAIFLP